MIEGKKRTPDPETGAGVRVSIAADVRVRPLSILMRCNTSYGLSPLVHPASPSRVGVTRKEGGEKWLLREKARSRARNLDNSMR